tara:strand:+ start:534 stop:752 length:219 start_codon:yes stop_codon:yes gene_type:complete
MNKTQVKEQVRAEGYDAILTVRECAGLFKTSTTHIYRQIKRGKIKASNSDFTGKVLIHLDDIAEALATDREA